MALSPNPHPAPRSHLIRKTMKQVDKGERQNNNEISNNVNGSEAEGRGGGGGGGGGGGELEVRKETVPNMKTYAICEKRQADRGKV